MSTARTVFLSTFVAFAASLVQAQDDVLKELDSLQDRYIALFNSHDAKALAMEYSEDTNVVYTDGIHISSRKEMEASLTENFKKNPKVTTKLSILKRTLLAEHIVLEDGTWEEAGHSEPGLPTKGMFTTVFVKKNGKWLIVHDRAWVK